MVLSAPRIPPSQFHLSDVMVLETFEKTLTLSGGEGDTCPTCDRGLKPVAHFVYADADKGPEVRLPF